MADEDGNQPRAEARLRFTGETSDYVRIVAVNWTLTLVTLGLYGPWARIRTTRFVVSHLAVPGHELHYDQAPLPMLARRILGIALLLLPSALFNLSPEAGRVGFTLALALFPFAIVWGWRDRAAAYGVDGVRCRFTGGYLQGLLFGVGFPVLTFITNGLLAVVNSWATWRALGASHEMLGAPMSVKPSIFRLFIVLILTFVLTLPVYVLTLGVPFLFFINEIRQMFDGGLNENEAGLALALTYFAFVAAGVVFFFNVLNSVGTYVALARMTVLGAIRHPAAEFRVELKLRRLCGVLISNALLNLLTLGAAIPATRMRLWRCMANQISLVAPRADK